MVHSASRSCSFAQQTGIFAVPHDHPCVPTGMLQKRERVAVTAVAAACTLLCGAVLVMQATQDSSAGTGMDKSNPIGWAAVLGAIVIFGSFFLLLKSEGAYRSCRQRGAAKRANVCERPPACC